MTLNDIIFGNSTQDLLLRSCQKKSQNYLNGLERSRLFPFFHIY